jgi:N-acetylmuramate 1-kinase
MAKSNIWSGISVATVSFENIFPSTPIVEYLKQEYSVKQIELELAGSAGSSRKYVRIRSGLESWMLQQSNNSDTEFDRFVEYAHALKKIGLNVPTILQVDKDSWQVLLTDLGDKQLFHAVQNSGLTNSEHLFLQVLDELKYWQRNSNSIFEKLPQLQQRDFGIDDLLWETSYFTENYLVKEKGKERGKLEKNNALLDTLAQTVANHPKAFMHRDFQSKNIMLNNSQAWFIDFQSARNGSAYYDVASLLWDPYIGMDLNSIKRFFTYFLMDHPILQNSEAPHYTHFLEASAQRIMQACGAYCFLTRVKKRDQFYEYLAPGIAQLKIILEELGGEYLALLEDIK